MLGYAYTQHLPGSSWGMTVHLHDAKAFDLTPISKPSSRTPLAPSHSRFRTLFCFMLASQLFVRIACFGTFLLLGGLTFSLAAEPEPIEPAQKIDLLADGLTPFYTWLQDTRREDPRRVFRIQDGVLHITGDGLGCITSHQSFRNYHLIAEFKFGEKTFGERAEKAKDSGILVHSFGEDGAYNGIWMRSFEAQVIEGGCGDFIVVRGAVPNAAELALTAEVKPGPNNQWIWQAGGERREFPRGRVNWFGRDPNWKDERGFRGKHDVESPSGEWTRMEVICDGATITVLVNGTIVNRAVDCRPSAGRIQIQTELAEIDYRKLELWPLGKAPSSKN